MVSHCLINLPPAHHSHPPSHNHCFIPGSKLTFSARIFPTVVCQHPPELPSRIKLDRTYYCTRRFFIFSYFFFLIILGRAGRLSWLNFQLSSATLISDHHISSCYTHMLYCCNKANAGVVNPRTEATDARVESTYMHV